MDKAIQEHGPAQSEEKNAGNPIRSVIYNWLMMDGGGGWGGGGSEKKAERH